MIATPLSGNRRPKPGYSHVVRSAHGHLPHAGSRRGQALVHQVLGVAPYFDQPFYVGFNVGGFELGLLPDAP